MLRNVPALRNAKIAEPRPVTCLQEPGSADWARSHRPVENGGLSGYPASIGHARHLDTVLLHMFLDNSRVKCCSFYPRKQLVLRSVQEIPAEGDSGESGIHKNGVVVRE